MKIDIQNIIRTKSLKIYNSIPKFAFRLIERVIHQSEINDILDRFAHLKGVEFISAVLDYLHIKRKINGLDEIDKTGRYIFVSNHPLGGLDGFVLAEAIHNKFGSVKVVVNDILMNLEPLTPIFVPINKHGKQQHHYIHTLNELYKSNTPILYFPAGLCSRKVNGEIKDLEWKKSFINKAKSYNRSIVPMFVENINSSTFYLTSTIRNFLGIKINIEMILLPDELFKMKNRATIDVKVGDVISLDNKIKDTKMCEIVRTKCYELKHK